MSALLASRRAEDEPMPPPFRHEGIGRRERTSTGSQGSRGDIVPGRRRTREVDGKMEPVPRITPQPRRPRPLEGEESYPEIRKQKKPLTPELEDIFDPFGLKKGAPRPREGSKLFERMHRTLRELMQLPPVMPLVKKRLAQLVFHKSEVQLAVLFSKADVGTKGFLDMDDLKRFMKDMDLNLSDLQVRKLRREIDHEFAAGKNPNGPITWAEFHRVVSSVYTKARKSIHFTNYKMLLRRMSGERPEDKDEEDEDEDGDDEEDESDDEDEDEQDDEEREAAREFFNSSRAVESDEEESDDEPPNRFANLRNIK